MICMYYERHIVQYLINYELLPRVMNSPVAHTNTDLKYIGCFSFDSNNHPLEDGLFGMRFAIENMGEDGKTYIGGIVNDLYGIASFQGWQSQDEISFLKEYQSLLGAKREASRDPLWYSGNFLENGLCVGTWVYIADKQTKSIKPNTYLHPFILGPANHLQLSKMLTTYLQLLAADKNQN